MNLAGHEFIDRELIGRVLRNMRPRRGERYKPRWVLVMGLFGFGSTVARAMCQEFALDPDEEIK
jgi:hypothetical protein